MIRIFLEVEVNFVTNEVLLLFCFQRDFNDSYFRIFKIKKSETVRYIEIFSRLAAAGVALWLAYHH